MSLLHPLLTCYDVRFRCVSLPDGSVCCIGVCARNITHKLVQREATLWRNRSSGPEARRAPIGPPRLFEVSVVQLAPDVLF